MSASDEIKVTGEQGKQREGVQVQAPDLLTLFFKKKMATMAEMNCVSIGRVVSFDNSKQTVDVDLMFYRVVSQQRSVPDDPDSAMVDVPVKYPRLLSCPLVVLSGGGSRMTFPVAPGDTCLVLFNDRDIDAWHQGGVPSVPNSNRMHDLSDGIALVGIRALTDSFQDYNEDGPEILNGVSKIAVKTLIEISVANVTLGSCFSDLFDALGSSNLNAETKALLQIVKAKFAGVLE